jgi:hypothetical protein
MNRYTGELDDLRLYSDAISATEVFALANPGQQALRIVGNDLKKQDNTSADTSSSEKLVQQASETQPENLKPILYPNPVALQIAVKDLWLENGPIRIAIYDMNGRLKMESGSHVADRSLYIDISDLRLSAGSYVLVLQDNFHREVIRFIKK